MSSVPVIARDCVVMCETGNVEPPSIPIHARGVKPIQSASRLSSALHVSGIWFLGKSTRERRTEERCKNRRVHNIFRYACGFSLGWTWKFDDASRSARRIAPRCLV